MPNYLSYVDNKSFKKRLRDFDAKRLCGELKDDELLVIFAEELENQV